MNNTYKLKSNIKIIYNNSNKPENKKEENKKGISIEKGNKYEITNSKKENNICSISFKEEEKNAENKKYTRKNSKKENKENIIILNLKKKKLGNESINLNNSNNNMKIIINKKIKKKYNSINNTNKEYNSNIIESKEKKIIENKTKNKIYNTLNNKKKNIKIINYDKPKNKFIIKSNSFLGKKNEEIRNLEKNLVPRTKSQIYSLNSSYKYLPNKNKNNDKKFKNSSIIYKTNDRPKNIVVKIDLSKI